MTTFEGLKTIEGQIASINFEKRLMALEDRAGIIFYSVSWLQPQDQKIQKLKVGYYVKPTVEVKGDSTGRLIDLPYSERPADWPKSKGGSGKQYQPRNEKPMVYESAFKSCAELVRPDDFPGMAYADRVEAVRAEAEKIAKWIVKEGGT